MKTRKYISFIVAVLGIGFFSACTDGNDWGIDGASNRVMTPKISSVKGGEGALDVSFTSYGGNAYLIEVNENPFSITDLDGDVQEGSITAIVTGSPGTISGLNGYTDYYVRMRSQSDSKTPSHWYYYAESSGTLKIAQTLGLQILEEVTDEDRQAEAITVRWIEGYAPTSITATYLNGEEKAVISYPLDDEARANRTFTCTGLTPSTIYAIRIYNGEECIGMRETKTLKAPPVADYTYTVEGDVIDQTIMDDVAAQAKENAGGAEIYAATFIIPAGKEVNVTAGTKGVVVPAGMTVYFYGAESSDNVKGTLVFPYQLDIAGNHGEISFDNLNITAPGTGSNKYIINQTNASSTGNITFTACHIYDVNCAVVRTQGSNAVNIGTITIDDCVITNQGTMNQSYGYVINAGCTGGTISEVEITNSTFNTCTVGIVNNNTKNDKYISKVKISDCTFYNCIGSGYYLVNAGKDASSKLLPTDITISNVVVGKLYNSGAKGYQTGAEKINLDHFYQTSGTKFNGGSFKSTDDGLKLDWRIGQFSDADMFEDPGNGNFTLKHWFEQTSADESKGQQFDIYGDPRWRQETDTDEGSGDEE